VRNEAVAWNAMNWNELARYLARGLSISGEKVCIGSITVEEKFQEPLANGILQDLEWALSPSMEVLERKRLQDIISQHRLETSQFFARENLERLGHFTQVNYVVLGSMQERMSDYEIFLKMVSMKTAIIAKTAKAYLSKDQIPRHIIQAMAHEELLAKGHPRPEQEPALPFFTQSYLSHVGTTSKAHKSLEVQFQVWKKRNGEISPLNSGETLQPKDQYQIQIQVNHPTYVYSISMGSDGRVIPIFPRGDSASNPLEPNQIHYFPNADTWFTVPDALGLVQIGMIVSWVPIPGLEQVLQQPLALSSQEPAAIQTRLFPEPSEIQRKRKLFQPSDTTTPSGVQIFSQDILLIPLYYTIQSHLNKS